MSTLTVDTQNTLFSAAPGSSDGTLVGRDITTLVGFFGATPVAIATVPLTTPAVQDIIDALVGYGLIVQSD